MLELLVTEALGLFDPALWSGSEGNRDGSGLMRSSSREISREPWTLRPSILIAGTVMPGNRSAFSATHETTGSRSVRL